jgi:hypothetical protein
MAGLSSMMGAGGAPQAPPAGQLKGKGGKKK